MSPFSRIDSRMASRIFLRISMRSAANCTCAAFAAVTASLTVLKTPRDESYVGITICGNSGDRLSVSRYRLRARMSLAIRRAMSSIS